MTTVWLLMNELEDQPVPVAVFESRKAAEKYGTGLDHTWFRVIEVLYLTPPDRKPDMSNLIDYATQELDALGMGDTDADYDGMLKPAVLEILEVFSRQGHSGHSAAIVSGLVEKLMRYEPLSPLTGADDEWNELDYSPEMAAQSRRCSHVFRRADGTAYDIYGRTFREPDGLCFVGKGSRVDITFPYTPTTEYVDVPAITPEP